MRWYIPSFHGDFRFEGDKQLSQLTVEKPTPGEVEAIERWGKRALKLGWVTQKRLDDFIAAAAAGETTKNADEQLAIDAPLSTAAAPMAKILGFGKVGLITALAFESGKVKMTEVLEKTDLPKWMEKLTEAAKAAGDAARAAVTVSRPRLSCPECSGRPEGERKACDVLWDFLDSAQRAEWLKARRFTAFGSATGHAYDIAPRDTLRAGQRGRICFDMDDKVILHNFDLTLPPEEEALQAKLVLEHREPWLRVFGEVDPLARASPGTVFHSQLPPVYR